MMRKRKIIRMYLESTSLFIYYCVCQTSSSDTIGCIPSTQRMAAEIDPFPSPESYKGIGTSLEAAGGNSKDLDHLRKAVEAYRKALEKCNKASIMFYMGVALERLGEVEEAEPILEVIQRSEAPTSCLNDSWGYVR